MNVKLISRLMVVPMLLIFGAGCDLNNVHLPDDQPATPVLPIEMVIELESDAATLTTLDTSAFARIKVKVIRSVIWKVPADGTKVVLKTNLGNYQSLSGPQTITLSLFDGVANTIFYGGDEPGVAILTATIGNDFGELEIEINSDEPAE
jgi:hypothetical protein